MYLIRRAIETKFHFTRHLLFWITQEDPELAHDLIVNRAQFMHKYGLTGFLLGTPENQYRTRVELANAAGFNKEGLIPPHVLKEVGFDRCIVGTVTYEPWSGNPRPRVKRFPPGSLVNWMGLPGSGAKKVAENLNKYMPSPIPLTINIAPTPCKEGIDAVEDLVMTIGTLEPYASEWELNISCPNTVPGDREKHQKSLENLLWGVTRVSDKPLFVKISPDMDAGSMKEMLDVCAKYKRVAGFTATNTTTRKGGNGIPIDQKGGASGDAVATLSYRSQDWLSTLIEQYHRKSPWTIHACGGISRPEMAKFRAGIPRTTQIQLFTPLIYQGPRIVRELRKAFRVQ